jgi:MFS family permease
VSNGGLSAFRSRDFRLFWLGGVVSNSGSWIQNLAVPYVVFQQTGSALWVGVASACQFIPSALASIPGGNLADRFERRTLLLVIHIILFAIGVLLWWTVLVDYGHLGMLLGLVALMGATWGLAVPSWQALVTDLVPQEDLVSAVSLNTVQFNLARSIGPAFAGLILAFFGPAPAFAANALTYLVAAASLALVRSRSRPGLVGRRNFLRDFRNSISYTWSHNEMRVAIAVTVVVIFLGSPVFTLPVIFAADVFHVGPLALGLLSAATGIGAVVAVPFVTSSRVGISSALRLGLVLLGVGTLLLGIVPTAVAAALVLVLGGFGYVAGNSAVMSSLQLAVDPALRGRVMAIRVLLAQVGIAIGALTLGWLTDTIGPGLAAVVWGVTAVVAGAWMSFGLGQRLTSMLDQ